MAFCEKFAELEGNRGKWMKKTIKCFFIVQRYMQYHCRRYSVSRSRKAGLAREATWKRAIAWRY